MNTCRGMAVVLILALGLSVPLGAAQARQGEDNDQVKLLLQLVDQPDVTSRVAAISLVGDLAEAARARLRTAAPNEPGYPTPLLKTIREAGPRVAAQADSPDAAIRRTALRALGKMRAPGDVAAPLWVKALLGNDPDARAAAATALRDYLARAQEINDGRSGDRIYFTEQFLQDLTVLVPAVRTILESKNSEAIRAVLSALNAGADTLDKLPDLSSAEPFGDESSSAGARRQIVAAAEQLRVLNLLLGKEAPRFDSRNQRLAAQLLENLARLVDPRLDLPQGSSIARTDIFGRTIPATADPNREARESRGPRGRLLKSDLKEEGQRAAELLTTSLARTIHSMQSTLATGANGVQLALLDAIEVLGKQAREMVPLVVQRLEDENLFVRWSATRALGRIGPTEHADLAVRSLANRLRDDDLDVRLTAAQALENFGSHAAPAIPALAAALAIAETELQLSVAQTLDTIIAVVGQEGKTAVPALIDALESKDARVRQIAARILMNVGPSAREALPALQKAMEDVDLDVRQAAARAIGRITAK